MKTFELLTCPWCGDTPKMVPWHGGGPRKTMVSCHNDHCHVSPGVCAPNAAKAARRWNNRLQTRYVDVVKKASL